MLATDRQTGGYRIRLKPIYRYVGRRFSKPFCLFIMRPSL